MLKFLPGFKNAHYSKLTYFFLSLEGYLVGCKHYLVPIRCRSNQDSHGQNYTQPIRLYLWHIQWIKKWWISTKQGGSILFTRDPSPISALNQYNTHQCSHSYIHVEEMKEMKERSDPVTSKEYLYRPSSDEKPLKIFLSNPHKGKPILYRVCSF